MMGLGGAGGSGSARRRRMVATFVDFAMVLTVGAKLLSILLS